MRRNLFICLLLAGITLALYWPAGHLGFIIYDDHGYVVENTNIQAGITFASIRWAFTTTQASNWHPITWLSHMLDYQLYGLNASGHHWTNVALHIINTLLLFMVLQEMMGLRRDDPQQPYDSPPRNANKMANAAIAATTPQAQTVWRSAWVAALFAWHPLHVQSVVWVSERKDLLSGFFMLLTLWAWVRYAQGAGNRESGGKTSNSDKSRVNIQHPTSNAQWCYWSAVFFFALGLMSKPMLVTLPVILLLLDFWPLGRISEFGVRSSELKSVPQRPTLNHLLIEKVPFLALSLASSIVTVWAQSKGGAVVSLMKLPWYARAMDSLVFYTAYLEKMFWPVNLSVLYPYQRMEPWEFIRDALLPVLLSVLLIRRWRSQPYLFTGWFWFLVMLVPVIGLVQVGGQSIADRYTYLPSIGLFILVAWAAAELAQRSRLWQTGMTLGLAAVLAACLADTRFQLRYWRDSITLFRHSVEVTRGSYCYFSLANAYLDAGNLEDAAGNYRIALQLYPNFPKAHYYFGNVLLRQKKYAEAREEFGEVLRTNPEIAFAHKYLGDILAAQGKYVEAAAEYITALQLKPDDGVIRTALALATQNAGIEKALTNLFEALKTRPTAEIHAQIATLETTLGKFQDAVEHFREALRLKPDAPDVLNNLAWLLATCPDAHIRDGAQAVGYAERACELTQYGVTPMVGTLAAAYAEAGRFDEAIATAEKACALASESGDQDLLKRNQELLVLYRAHRPYHEVTSPDQAELPAAGPVSGDAEKPVPNVP